MLMLGMAGGEHLSFVHILFYSDADCQDLATLSQKTMLSRCPNPMLGLFLDRLQGISACCMSKATKDGEGNISEEITLDLVTGLR